MSPITFLQKEINTLKAARDYCSKAFNSTTNRTRRECLQLTTEVLCYTIAHKEIELEQLLTNAHGQRNADRSHSKEQPL